MADLRVAVIGAGVIGASVADALSVGGARVTMYDMRSPGAGASQASAGVLSPYIEAKPDSPLLAMGTRSLAMWDNFIGGLRRRAPDVQVEYARTGTLEVALDDAEVQRLHDAARWLQAEQVAHEYFDAASLATFAPTVTRAARAGLLIPSHGFVNVRELVRALVHAARLSGAVLITPTEILHVEQQGERARVRVGDRHEHDDYDYVVLATGSWSRRVRVAGVPPLSVRPIRGQLLHLRWPNGPRPAQSVWGPRCYTVPWADGSLLVGATVEDVGFDETSTVAGVRELMDAVVALLPEAAAASVDAVRVGLRPVTADHLPLLGPLPAHPRVVAATGHYRNGVLLAPLTADIILRLLLDGVRDAAFDAVAPATGRLGS